jgi:hypothetical protein
LSQSRNRYHKALPSFAKPTTWVQAPATAHLHDPPLLVQEAYPEHSLPSLGIRSRARTGGPEGDRNGHRYDHEIPRLVIFISGYADDAVLRHGVLSSELELIHEPLLPGPLLEKLRRVLDQTA